MATVSKNSLNVAYENSSGKRFFRLVSLNDKPKYEHPKFFPDSYSPKRISNLKSSE